MHKDEQARASMSYVCARVQEHGQLVVSYPFDELVPERMSKVHRWSLGTWKGTWEGRRDISFTE